MNSSNGRAVDFLMPDPGSNPRLDTLSIWKANTTVQLLLRIIATQAIGGTVVSAELNDRGCASTLLSRCCSGWFRVQNEGRPSEDLIN